MWHSIILQWTWELTMAFFIFSSPAFVQLLSHIWLLHILQTPLYIAITVTNRQLSFKGIFIIWKIWHIYPWSNHVLTFKFQFQIDSIQKKCIYTTALSKSKIKIVNFCWNVWWPDYSLSCWMKWNLLTVVFNLFLF